MKNSSYQISIRDLQYLPYILRAGYLADSNRSLDTLLLWLSDQRTASYFNLKYLPGLFNSIIEQYMGKYPFKKINILFLFFI